MDAWTEIEKAEEQFLSNLAENGGLHPDLAGMLRHCSRFIAGLKRRAAAAAPQAAPAGMVLVPRERNIDDDPGDYESADPYSLGHCDGWNDCRKVMLAAAPAAQVAECGACGDGCKDRGACRVDSESPSASPAVVVDEVKDKESFERWFCTAYPGGGGRSGDASLKTVVNHQGQAQYKYTSTEQAWEAWQASAALAAALNQGKANG